MYCLDSSSDCIDCRQFKECEEINTKIEQLEVDKDDFIDFYKANKLLKDIFSCGYSHHYSLRDYAVLKGYAVKRIKANKKDVWKITYNKLFEMMFERVPFFTTTPIYKKNHGGFIYGKN